MEMSSSPFSESEVAVSYLAFDGLEEGSSGYLFSLKIKHGQINIEYVRLNTCSSVLYTCFSFLSSDVA